VPAMLLRQSVVPAGLALGPKSDIRKDVKRLIGTVFVRFLGASNRCALLGHQASFRVASY
jgi:hypothetical protein